MHRSLFAKIKEAMASVLPVTAAVLLMALLPWVSFSWYEIGVFVASAASLIVGIALFNLGADMAMSPMGEHVGAGLAKTGKMSVLLTVCFLMGVLITVAEPDLTVLSEQVSAVIDRKVLIFSVGAGVGLFLVLGLVKIVRKKNLTPILMFFYLIMFSLATLVFEKGEGALLPMAFDSGGVTTGPITVPFLMALGVGIAAVTTAGGNSGENSFGLISLCSVGPILAVLALAMFSKGDLSYATPDYSVETRTGVNLPGIILHSLRDVAISLVLIAGFFLILQLAVLKLPLKRLLRIGIGIAYTFVGLVIFMTSVSVGFMPIGYKLGSQLGENSKYVLVAAGLVIGMLTVLAEPAVHVLNHQVEEITGGSISSRSMMAALCAGVGISIALSMLRVVLGFSLLYYLIPGYLLSLGLSFFVPGIYTAIAFDSGGVASGPLTSSFILPLTIGACVSIHGDDSVLGFAFGVVAMVAMTPLITIQVLGFKSVVGNIVRNRAAMKRIISADDEQIINFALEE
jgi:hypothetical protein